MHQSHLYSIVSASFIALATAACGKKTDLGKVQVSLSNSSGSASLALTPEGSTGTVVVQDGRSLAAYQATSWALKIISIYLVEDVSGDGWTNVGPTSYIWINPACGIETRSSGEITMANESNCNPSAINTYFELARSSAEVNADLSSQNIPVAAKTYRYVHMDLCDNRNGSESNIKIASTTGGLPTPIPLRTGNCVVLSKIDPPLTVKDGDNVKLSLGYDLSKAIVDYNYDTTKGTYSNDTTPGTYCAASQTGQGIRCPSDIVYKATVTK
jgi:hypothetical protein